MAGVCQASPRCPLIALALIDSHRPTIYMQDLKDYFAGIGAVKFADVLREGGPGTRSKGCGIVEFETAEEAASAIEQLNHTQLDGRQIFIREDREDFELKGDGHTEVGGSIRGPQKRHRTSGTAAISIGRRVYVGNLSPETTWQDLKDHFRQAGQVARADILTDADGNSKSCGLVEFQLANDALRAISLLSNSMLHDRQIMVREDREDSSYSKGRGGTSFLGGNASEGTRVVLHGLPYRLAWQDLKDFARQAGQVVRADIMSNPDGSSKGYGVVVYESPEVAAKAVSQLTGATLEGRVITVKYDKFA